MLGENKQLKEKLAETRARLTQASSFPPARQPFARPYSAAPPVQPQYVKN
jgi:hypothetical protein